MTSGEEEMPVINVSSVSSFYLFYVLYWQSWIIHSPVQQADRLINVCDVVQCSFNWVFCYLIIQNEYTVTVHLLSFLSFNIPHYFCWLAETCQHDFIRIAFRN
jgi:predicted neutral ceramidase superfamily lipid hydrolase